MLNHALMPFKDIAYGFDILFESSTSFLYALSGFPQDHACMYDTDDHKQGGEEWRPLLQKASIAQRSLKRKIRRGTWIA